MILKNYLHVYYLPRTTDPHQGRPRPTWRVSSPCCTRPDGHHPPKPKLPRLCSPKALSCGATLIISGGKGGSGMYPSGKIYPVDCDAYQKLIHIIQNFSL